MEEASKERTYFMSRHGLYRVKRIPLDLYNSPGKLQRTIELILAQEKWQCEIVYLDDIIIFS